MTPKEFNNCLARIKRGDNSGLEQIYNFYYEKIVVSAQYELHDRYKAEEIASNIMVNILKNAKKFSYVRNPNMWISRATQFAVFSSKMNVKLEVLTGFDFLSGAIFPESVYAGDNDTLTFRMAFYEILDKCTERQRNIICMHYVHKLNLRETAKVMNISVSTVKREIIIMREKMRALYNQN